MGDGGEDKELIKSRTPEKVSFGNNNRMWLFWKEVERMKKKERMDDDAEKLR